MIAPFLEQALEARIVVINRSGAGGTIGAAMINQAPPDGRTMGILNAAGLMVKAMAGGKRTPHPATDFTILGRVMRIEQIWAVPADSPFTTIEEVLEAAQHRPILFGMRDVGSTSFVNVAVVADLLGMPVDIVAGYQGTQAKSLASQRGEVDVNVFTYETVLHQIENGDLRPVLQVAVEPIDDHPCLHEVPLLGGEDGVAARRARLLGRDVDQAIADAAALAGLVGAGRLMVAPPDMDPGLTTCLEEALLGVLHSSEFARTAARSGLSLNILPGEAVRAELEAVAAAADRFVPIFEEAMAGVRE